MENYKNNKFTITPEEALIDGLSLISQKLNDFIDGKRTNIQPVSELLLRLAIPREKTSLNSEDIFIAVEQITSLLESMEERRKSGLNWWTN